jgi:hypothetical protein
LPGFVLNLAGIDGRIENETRIEHNNIGKRVLEKRVPAGRQISRRSPSQRE